MIKSFFIKKLTKDFNSRITVFGRDEFYLFLSFLFLFLGFLELSLKLFISFFIAYILVSILRLVYFKERPIKYKVNTFLDRIEASSFPSMHVVRLSILLSLIYFEFSSNYYLLGLFSILLLLVSISRIKLKRHYRIDVYAGILIGLVIAYTINYIFNLFYL
jgi:membrane-associated phospholipid phosphatase